MIQNGLKGTQIWILDQNLTLLVNCRVSLSPESHERIPFLSSPLTYGLASIGKSLYGLDLLESITFDQSDSTTTVHLKKKKTRLHFFPKLSI